MFANDKHTTQSYFVDGRKLGLVSEVTRYTELMRVVCPQCHLHLPCLLHCPLCVYMVCSLPLCLLCLLCISLNRAPFSIFLCLHLCHLFFCFLSHLCFLNLSYYLKSYLSMCISDSVVCVPMVAAQVLGSSGSVERRLRMNDFSLDSKVDPSLRTELFPFTWSFFYSPIYILAS